MLVQTSNVIGLDIFSVREGKNIDKVQDVIYDPSSQRILALIVNSGGIFSDGKALSMEDIKSIGGDAVIIESEELLKNTSDLPDRAHHIADDDTHLTKSKVMSESGTNLGSISDLLFDSRSGEVVELIVTQGGLRDLQSGQKRVKPEDITTVGEDAIIVKSYTESEFDQQGRQSGTTGLINQAKESIQEAWDNAEHNLNEMTDDARQKWEDPNTQAKISQTKSDAQQKAEQGKDKLQQTADQAKERFDQFGNDPNNQRKLKDMKNTAEDSLATIKQGAQDKKSEIDQGREVEALGQYITRNVIDQHDKVIARRGQIVTQSTINQAKQSNLLGNVMKNLSKEPVPKPAGVLGGEVEAEIERDSQLDPPIDQLDIPPKK